MKTLIEESEQIINFCILQTSSVSKPTNFIESEYKFFLILPFLPWKCFDIGHQAYFVSFLNQRKIEGTN